MTDSVRVVTLPDGSFETRKVHLDEEEAPWIYAALRHQAWLRANPGSATE